MTGRALVAQADAIRLPLRDESVDLALFSPPYWQLRSYGAGAGEIGSEETPLEFLEHLWAVTREVARALKPTGSIFVNLGDSYADRANDGPSATPGSSDGLTSRSDRPGRPRRFAVGRKSLYGLPWCYALGCTGMLAALGGPDPGLDLILRAEIIADKPNCLPESVRDRVRRSHEQWFHLTRFPRYYSALDEIREPPSGYARPNGATRATPGGQRPRAMADTVNPLGALPGSVWRIPSEPLRLPPWLGVQHYACVDTETEVLTKRGWLRYGDLREGDTVAGYDLAAGLAEWTPCRGVSAYDYDGDLVSVEKGRLSMRLTPNHRCVVARTDGNDKHRGPPEIVRADALNRRCAVPRSAEWKDDGGTEGIGEVLAAVCGWVASEGYYTPEGYVHLTQSLTVNAEKVRAIDDLLAGLPNIAYDLGAMNIYRSGPKWRARSKIGGVDRGASFQTLEEAQAWVRGVRDARGLDGLQRVERRADYKGREVIDVVWRLPRGVAQRIRELMPDKHLTQQLANLPASEARALLEAFIEGDGHRHVRGAAITIFQKHRPSLDWLQVIAVRLGYRTSIKPARNGYVLHLDPSQHFLTLRSHNPAGAIRREHYRGVVWCPMTGTGTFIARRNGSVFITGNSFASEWPRRLVLAFSPPGICLECGEGRWPVVDRQEYEPNTRPIRGDGVHHRAKESGMANSHGAGSATILGYACACAPFTDRVVTPTGYHECEHGDNQAALNAAGHAVSARGVFGAPRPDEEPRTTWDISGEPSTEGGCQACACISNGSGKVVREYHLAGWQAPPTRPAVVLDPFGGVGTSAMVARALGRIGLSFDLSFPYSRAARWRVTSDHAAKAISRTNRERQGSLL